MPTNEQNTWLDKAKKTLRANVEARSKKVSGVSEHTYQQYYNNYFENFQKSTTTKKQLINIIKGHNSVFSGVGIKFMASGNNNVPHRQAETDAAVAALINQCLPTGERYDERIKLTQAQKDNFNDIINNPERRMGGGDNTRDRANADELLREDDKEIEIDRREPITPETDVINAIDAGLQLSRKIDARYFQLDAATWRNQACEAVINPETGEKRDVIDAIKTTLDQYSEPCIHWKHHKKAIDQCRDKLEDRDIPGFMRKLSAQLEDKTLNKKGELSARLEAINFYYEDFPGKAALEGFLNKHAPKPTGPMLRHTRSPRSQIMPTNTKRVIGQEYNDNGGKPEDINRTRTEYIQSAGPRP